MRGCSRLDLEGGTSYVEGHMSMHTLLSMDRTRSHAMSSTVSLSYIVLAASR